MQFLFNAISIQMPASYSLKKINKKLQQPAFPEQTFVFMKYPAATCMWPQNWKGDVTELTLSPLKLFCPVVVVPERRRGLVAQLPGLHPDWKRLQQGRGLTTETQRWPLTFSVSLRPDVGKKKKFKTSCFRCLLSNIQVTDRGTAMICGTHMKDFFFFMYQPSKYKKALIAAH